MRAANTGVGRPSAAEVGLQAALRGVHGIAAGGAGPGQVDHVAGAEVVVGEDVVGGHVLGAAGERGVLPAGVPGAYRQFANLVSLPRALR